VRVNGVETTRFATNDMLFGVAAYISAITRYITLVPGDVIWMGTDGTSPDLKPGDTVDVEIAGIGVLSNPFVAASQAA
jgi:2-keto-4-pentenoate hydratase/2-oxohepta-3-ene-1,7-dioic acid hydratase in catechol pathway